MSGIVRWIVGIPLAMLVTFVLFVLMKALITDELDIGEKGEKASFEINPKVDEIKEVERETKIEKVKQIETPPPPPQIERQQASKPTEAIATLEGAIPEFVAPKIDPGTFKIAVSDRDAQPLVRIPPNMPPRADKSGHCKVRFDVSPTGAPFNVVATYCTGRVFERPSIKSVEKWKYNPKIQDGVPVGRTGVENKITFRLTDERGNIIPE